MSKAAHPPSASFIRELELTWPTGFFADMYGPQLHSPKSSIRFIEPMIPMIKLVDKVFKGTDKIFGQ